MLRFILCIVTLRPFLSQPIRNALGSTWRIAPKHSPYIHPSGMLISVFPVLLQPSSALHPLQLRGSSIHLTPRGDGRGGFHLSGHCHQRAGQNRCGYQSKDRQGNRSSMLSLYTKILLLYGAESWWITKTATHNVQTFVNKCLRKRSSGFAGQTPSTITCRRRTTRCLAKMKPPGVDRDGTGTC